MKRWLLCSALALVLTGSVSGQTAQFWINDGIITAPPDIPPQVDAVNFINNNTISLDLGLAIDYRPLFDTSSTLNFTNFGLMSVDTGFRFDTEPANLGVARWAANFHNTGVINSGTDTNFLNTNIFFFTLNPSTTFVSATNIVSPGTFNMGFESLLKLNGGNVDLSRGQVTMAENGFNLGGGGLFITFNQGFVDGYWGLSTNVMDPQFQFEFPPPLEPFSLVTDRNYFTRFQQLGGDSFVNYLSDFTDASGSNRFVRAVFLNNTNVDYAVNVYLPLFGDIEVEWISQSDPTNFIYLFDDFGVITNFQLAVNGFAGPRPTFIPVNYSFFTGARLNLGTPETTVPIPPGTFDAGIFTNQYSAYEALFLSTTRGLTDTPGQNITNTPGRVEITATNTLDLTLARIQSGNYINLEATNQFVGSIGSRLAAPFYDLNLRNTNGTFAITNLVIPTIHRPEGTIELYSARWTNLVNGVTNRFHVLFVDSRLATSLPTRQQDVTLRSTNTVGGADSIVLNDILHVTRKLLLDTSALTIATNDSEAISTTGGIDLQSPDILWSTSAPRLQFLTNNGFISTLNAVFFGGSRSSPFYNSTFNEPYQAFVNRGSVTDFGSLIWARYFENSGTFLANNNGSIQLQATTAVLTNGSWIAPGGGISIFAGSLLASNHLFLAGGPITLAITNVLDDGSLLTSSADFVTNKNIWIGSGFNLLATPQFGSLLGTVISNSATPFQRVVNRSAVADRGCSAAGFINNAAVGTLILDGGTNSLFEFSATGGANAIYIDLLDLRDFTAVSRDANGNFTGMQVDPGMKVYFGDALANGVSVAEKLDGKNGGRFCWVSSFNCGFFSSTNLLYPGGATNRVNRALAQSCTIDSNGNGIVNCMDPAPIPGGGCVPPPLLTIDLPPVDPPPSDGGGSSSGSQGGRPTLDFPGRPAGGTGSNTMAVAKASYLGLLYDTNGVTAATSGYLTAKTTDQGSYSAKLNLAGKTYSLSGRFDAQGRATATVARVGAGALKVELQLDLSGGDQLRGRVSSGNWSSDLLADRVVWSKTHPAGQAGNYTLVIPGSSNAGSPRGSGFGTVKVDAAGVVKWVGTLADGTKVSQGSGLSKQGIWPLYSSVYGGGGVVVSWMQFASQAQSDLGGQLVWTKPAGMAGYYPRGFTNEVMAMGSAYQAPAAGRRALNLSTGSLVLSGGGLNGSVTNGVTLGLNNKATGPGGVSLSITPATGLFKGSAIDAGTGKPLSFQGVLFKKGNIGVGYFLGTDQSGEVYLGSGQ